MNVTPLPIAGAFVLDPIVRPDTRGEFFELFKASAFREATGHELVVAQTNVSVNRVGAVRGIHYADVPPGQAKYVTCVSGSVLDVVVDLRVGSPTFGKWDSVLLDTKDRRAIFLSEGLGHGFLALEDNSTVVYLCSTGYNPDREHEVHPLDPEIGIDWPTTGADGRLLTYELSAKDQAAPTLADAREAGRLPHA